MLSNLLGHSFDGMLVAMSASYAALGTLIVAFAYVLGVLFVIVSIFQLRAFSEREIQSVRTPIATFIAGTLMLSLPSLIGTLTEAAFDARQSPLAYVRTASPARPIGAVLGLVEIIGLIAIMRSITIMKHMGDSRYGPEQASMGRALAFLIGGIAAVNIKWTAMVIGSTLGFNVGQWL